MAVNIIAELDQMNQIVRVIKALAMTSIDQTPDSEYPPHWAMVLDLLADKAGGGMDDLHDRLTALFHSSNLEVAGLVKGQPYGADL